MISEYARKKDFLLLLMTNGTFITAKKADKIAALKKLPGVEIGLL